jgi:hypothetical protein
MIMMVRACVCACVYRGYDLRGSNILFTNGEADPWHTLSINKDLPAPAGVRAVTYAAGSRLSRPHPLACHARSCAQSLSLSLSFPLGAGHCAPMTQPTNQDPASLQNARVVVTNFLASLLRH